MVGAGHELIHGEGTSLKRHYEGVVGVMELIGRLARLKLGTLTVSSLAEQLALILVEKTPFTHCSIFQVHESTHVIRQIAHTSTDEVPWKSDERGRLPFLIQSAFSDFVSRIWRYSGGIYLEDARQDPCLGDIGSAFYPMSVVGMPIRGMGVVLLVSNRILAFSEDEKHCWSVLQEVLSQMFSTTALQDALTDQTHALLRQLEEKDRQLKEKTEELSSLWRILQRIVDHGSQGIALLNEKGEIYYAGKQLVKLLEYLPEELLGQSPGMFFEEDEEYQRLRAEMESKGTARLSDTSLRRADGTRFSANVFLVRVPSGKDGPGKGLFFLEDLTEKKTFSEQLVRTEKLAALGTMAGGVAHDFNNLLMSILGNTQLLAKEIGKDRLQVKRRLRNIEQAVNDGAHIVRRLQSFTEKSREMSREGDRVDIEEAVIDVLELTKPRWKNSVEKQGSSIRIEKKLTPGLYGAINPSDLREVITNLVFNAVDAMPSGGCLFFRSYRSGDRVVLEVGDTGVGMDPETQRKIFDPFFTTKGVGNSGLGLSVCWSLIHRSGGDLLVRSEVGRGTTFVIRLPAAEEKRDAASGDVCASCPERKRLLVVDDEVEILELLGDMLRLMGHQVTTTNRGSEAVDLLSSETFDLVLTDLGMPDMNGWELAKVVKDMDPSLPVILVTGWGAQYEGQDLSDRCVDLVLSKPLSYQKLLEALVQFF